VSREQRRDRISRLALDLLVEVDERPPERCRSRSPDGRLARARQPDEYKVFCRRATP
jgi:hypothetical protein